MGLIWLSQILRIIEFQYSISHQIHDIVITTLFSLPSFITPLMPFLLLIGSFFISNKTNNSNEIVILKQYLSKKDISKISFLITTIIFLIHILNNEIISKNLYEKYKIKEIEIRNNLKLGAPTQSEFHIDNLISIFFDHKTNDSFNIVQAIIYPENQLINSESVQIELSKSNFNLVFTNGERLILNENEKSKTLFDKFIYTLADKEFEILLKDKEHYNTLELINHENSEFNFHGHNNIFQYIFLFLVCLVTLKIIFYYNYKKTNYIKFLFIFSLVLASQTLNSFLLYLLNNTTFFIISYYYISLLIILSFIFFFINRLIR